MSLKTSCKEASCQVLLDMARYVVLEEKCLLKIYKSAIVLLLALLFNLESVNAMKFHEVLLNLAW